MLSKPLPALLAACALAACESNTQSSLGPGSSGPGGPSDPVWLVLPGGGDWITTPLEGLTIAGILQDLGSEAGLPAAVDWTRTHEDGQVAGSAAVGPDGSFTIIAPLLAGDNEVLFRGDGVELGRLVATHNPGYAFGSALEAAFEDNGTLTAFEGEQAIARLDLELFEPATDTERVRLVRVFEGAELPLGVFSDAGEGLFSPGPLGQAPSGDLLAGDGRFANRLFLGAKAPGAFRVRAVVELLDGGEARSEVLDLHIAPPFAAGDLPEMLEALEQWRAQLLAAEIAGEVPERLRAIADELQQSPLVLEADYDEVAGNVWYVTRSGVAGVIALFEFGQKGAAGSALPAVSAPAAVASPGSRRVRTVAPFAHEFGAQDDAAMVAERFAADERFDVQSAASTGTGTFDLGAFHDLDELGVLHLSTHGTLSFRSISSTQAAAYGLAPGQPRGLLHANASATAAEIEAHAAKFLEGRLVLWTSQTGTHMALSAEHLGTGEHLPGTLAIVSACDSILPAAGLLRDGASAALAFSGCTGVAFAGQQTVQAVDGLLSGQPLGASAPTGVLAPGASEGALALLGSAALAFTGEPLLAGSFEAPAIGAAWDLSGSPESLVRLGQVRPTGAVRMAALQVGLPDSASSAQIAQSFEPGVEANLVRFDWNLVSAELGAAAANDSIAVRLLAADGGAEDFSLLFEQVAGLGEGAEPLAVPLGGTEATVLGWRTFEAPIPAALMGRRVRLEFTLEDPGNDGRSTVLLIDRVRTP